MMTLPKRLTGCFDLRRYYDLRAQQIAVEARKQTVEDRKEFCGACIIGTLVVVLFSLAISALLIRVL